MHEQFKWYDACPNAVQLSPKSLNSQNWLEHRGINTKKKPQNLENLLINLKDIDELIIIHDRIQKLMTK